MKKKFYQFIFIKKNSNVEMSIMLKRKENGELNWNIDHAKKKGRNGEIKTDKYKLIRVMTSESNLGLYWGVTVSTYFRISIPAKQQTVQHEKCKVKQEI